MHVSHTQNHDIDAYFSSLLLPTGDGGVRELSQMWGKDESISEINLSAHKIGPDAAEALASALRESLSITSVDCSLNSVLGNEGARLLVPALRTDGTGISTVRVLSLMRCGIGDVGEKSRFVVAFTSSHATASVCTNWWQRCSCIPITVFIGVFLLEKDGTAVFRLLCENFQKQIGFLGDMYFRNTPGEQAYLINNYRRKTV